MVKPATAKNLLKRYMAPVPLLSDKPRTSYWRGIIVGALVAALAQALALPPDATAAIRAAICSLVGC